MEKFKIAIVAKAKQGFIYEYLIKHNLSMSQLAAQIGISYNTLRKIINFEWTPAISAPRNSWREIKKMEVILKIQRYFNVDIELLFPAWMTKELAEKLQTEYVDIKEIDCLQIQDVSNKLLMYEPFGDKEDFLLNACEKIPKVLSTLTRREEICLRLRFGLHE